MRCEVYRCLPKSGGCGGGDTYSVRALEGIDKGRVIAHPLTVVLVGDPWVQLVVQPAGNARVRVTGQKNVHAFFRGELALWLDNDDQDGVWPRSYTDSGLLAGALDVLNANVGVAPLVRVKYNPFRDTAFKIREHVALSKAQVALMTFEEEHSRLSVKL